MPTRSILAGFVVLLFFSAAGPYPDPWKWAPATNPPTLTLYLGVPVFRQSWNLPQGTLELSLVLHKYLMLEEGLTLEWGSDGKPWLLRQKKIPGEVSTELVRLPPGKLITLKIRSRSGAPLAELTLLRK